MSKRKKHGYADRLKYMHMLEDGYSLRYIHDHFGIDITLLSMLWEGYQKYGPPFLEKKKVTKATTEIKLKAIRDFEEKHLSLAEVMSRYDISRSALCHWRKLYHEGGIAELSRIKRKGRPPGMGRPKQKTVEQMTELERLQKEVQELRTENALLKKVRALVEERNARLYEIGHKPSKN